LRLIACRLTSLAIPATPPSILCLDILASATLRASLHARSGHGCGGGGGGLALLPSLFLSLSVQPFKPNPYIKRRLLTPRRPAWITLFCSAFSRGASHGMSSLLENPLQAVLYLKELTAIVQNQQSLIQTQRYRIDILERRLEDLAGENRQLRDSSSSHHRHPPRYHPPPPPRTSSLPRTSRAGTPPVSQTQQEHHSPLDMQLVPAGPSNASPDSADEDDDEAQNPCCRSLVPQTPATLCRAVGLPRTSE